jgi:hypothetical protein
LVGVGVAPAEPFCATSARKAFKSKVYSATPSVLATDFSIVSSSFLPSMVATEASDGLYYSTVIYQSFNTLKIKALDGNLKQYKQVYTIAALVGDVASSFGNVVAVNEYAEDGPGVNAVLAFYYFDHKNPTNPNLTRIEVTSPGPGWRITNIL